MPVSKGAHTQFKETAKTKSQPATQAKKMAGFDVPVVMSGLMKATLVEIQKTSFV